MNSLPYCHSRPRATREEPRQERKARTTSRCYHHKWNETSVHRPRIGHLRSCHRPFRWPSHCRPNTIRGTIRAAIGRRYAASRCCTRFRFRRSQPHRRTSCRETRDPDRTQFQPGRRRLFEAIPARGRHSLARGQRRLFSVARGCLCPNVMACRRGLPAFRRSQNILGYSIRRERFSLPWCQLVLAGATPVAGIGHA